MWMRASVVVALLIGLSCFGTDAFARGRSRRSNRGMTRRLQQMRQQQQKAYQAMAARVAQARREAALHEHEKRQNAADAARKAKEHDRETARNHRGEILGETLGAPAETEPDKSKESLKQELRGDDSKPSSNAGKKTSATKTGLNVRTPVKGVKANARKPKSSK
jgi:hypothetical protein